MELSRECVQYLAFRSSGEEFSFLLPDIFYGFNWKKASGKHQTVHTSLYGPGTAILFSQMISLSCINRCEQQENLNYCAYYSFLSPIIKIEFNSNSGIYTRCQ
jgi:hypothetical protein